MPEVYQQDFPGKTRLRIWKLTESAEDYFSTFDDPEGLHLHDGIKLSKRKKEWLGLRYLLRTHDQPVNIRYAETGKPVLDAGYISLSHCKDMISMIESERPVGLDLQNPVDQISRIRTKFCRQDELDAAAIAPDPVSFLTSIWSAKEALFKIYGENIDFRGEMAFSTEEQDHIFLLKDGGMKRHELFFDRIEDIQVCICLDLT